MKAEKKKKYLSDKHLIPEWMRMLEYLNECAVTNPSKANREMNIAYTHSVYLLKHLEKRNLASSKIEGNRRVYSLTNKGNKAADKLIGFLDTCNHRARWLKRRSWRKKK